MISYPLLLFNISSKISFFKKILFINLKINTLNMIINTEVYPTICDFHIRREKKEEEEGKPTICYWSARFEIKNDNLRKLLKQINNFKICQNSSIFSKVLIVSKNINDFMKDLVDNDDDFHDREKHKILNDMQTTLMKICLEEFQKQNLISIIEVKNLNIGFQWC